MRRIFPTTCLVKLCYILSFFYLCYSSRLSFQNSPCSSKTQKSRLYVTCKVETDISSISAFLKSNFTGRIITELKLYPCFAKQIPDDCLKNLIIYNLQSYCPFEEIGENAFISVNQLYSLTLKHINFDTIPKAVIKLTRLEHLYFVYHKFSELNEELSNLSSLQTLKISNGQLSSISNQSFSRCPNLTSINLSQNRIENLAPEVFNSTQKLKILNLNENEFTNVDGIFEKINPREIELYRNNLSSIENTFRRNMTSVEILKLGRNPLKYVNSSALSGKVVNLKVLDLAQCELFDLDPNLIKNLSYLTKINVENNYLKQIPAKFFHHLQNLAEVVLSGNGIQILENVFFDNPKLQKVYITNNQIISLDNAFKNLPKLSELYLKENSIKELHQSQFEDCSVLKIVDLSINRIEILEKNSLDGLLQLEILNLSRNFFTNFNHSVQNLPQLSALYADNCNMLKLEENEFSGLQKLTTLSLYGNKFDNLNGAFRNLPVLESLYLEGDFETLTRDSLPQNLQLKFLALIAPLSCDCRLQWFLKWSLKNTVIGEPICNSPERLRMKSVTTLKLEDLLGCSNSCPCECIQLTYDAYVGMNCSHQNLSTVPDPIPERLGELFMDNNLLSSVDNSSLHSANFLIKLDLSSNILSDFNVSLPHSLTSLQLHKNILSRVDDLPRKLPNLNKISLSENPWICDCQTIEFKNWILNLSSSVEDSDNVKCGNLSVNKNLQNKVIISLTDSSLCPSPSLHEKIPYFKIFGLIVIIAVAVLALACFYRHGRTLGAILYWNGCNCLKRGENAEDGKIYDAIIIYHPFDRQYAKTVIATALINKNFTIFLPKLTEEKNWMPSITECRRIIIVLSKDFLENANCLEIFRSVYQQFFPNNLNKILIVKHDALPDVHELDTLPKSAITSPASLNSDNKYFSQKLLYFMPKLNSDIVTSGRCIETTEDDDDAALLIP